MKNRILLFITFIFLFVSLSAQQLIKEEEVVLKTATGDIYGTLKVPMKDKTIPVVLVIAGSGPTDRKGNQPMMQNNSLAMLTDGLYQKGIATLSFDKRGIGASMKALQREDDIRFEHYVEDAKLWVDLLAKDKRFSGITVVGHSEGSLIGMLAAKNNKSVSKYVSVAGPGQPANELLREQLNKQLATQPESVKNTVFSYLEKLEKGETFTDVPPMLLSLFRPSIQPYMISWFKYDPQKEIQLLTIPILIVQGTTDIQVSAEQADLLAKSNKKSQKMLLENMNHVLKESAATDMQSQMSTYTNPSVPLHKELIKVMSDFILK